MPHQAITSELDALRARVKELETALRDAGASSSGAPESTIPSQTRLFESLLQSLPFIYFRVNHEGICLESRGYGLARVGLTEGQFVGKKVYDHYPQFIDQYQRAFAGENVVYEGHGYANDQLWHFLNCLIPDQERDEVIGFGVDLTDLRLAERELAGRRQLLGLIRGLCSLAVSGAAPGAITVGAERMIREYFPERQVLVAQVGADGVASLGGTSLAPGAVGRDIGRITFEGRTLGLLRQGEESVVDDARQAPEPALGRIAAAIGAGSLLIRPLLSSGELIGILALYSAETRAWSPAEHEDSAEIAGALAIALSESITRARETRMKAALRQNEDRWRSLLQNAPSHIATVDRERTVLFANRTPAGFNPNDYIGTDVVRVVRPQSYRAMIKAINKVFATGEPVTIEVASYGDNKAEAWYTTTMAPLRRDGKIEQAIIISVDITERKKAEEALRISESRHRLLAENTSDIIWMRDFQTLESLYVSPSVQQARGFTPEEALAQTLEEMCAPGSVEPGREFIREFRGAVRPEDPNQFPERSAELEFTCKDGSTLWFENQMTLIRDEAGRPWRILGSSRDITSRRRAQLALKASEEKYRQIFQSETDSIVIFDTGSLTFIEVNDAAVRLYGYTRDELMRMTPVELSAEPEETKRVLRQGVIEGRPYRVPLRWHRKKNGDVFPVDLSCSPFKVAGRPYMCAIIRDISERLRAEEALRQSEENYRTLVNASMDLIVRTNEDGDYIFLNPAAQDVFRIGKNFLLFVHKEDLEGTRAIWDDISQGRPIRNFENRVIDQKGRLRYLAWSAVPYFDMNGKLTGVTAVARDVTSQKKAEAMIGEAGLTPREADIFRLCIRGYTNLNIALQLGIKESTVKYHLNTIFRKAGVQNRTELTALAR